MPDWRKRLIYITVVFIPLFVSCRTIRIYEPLSEKPEKEMFLSLLPDEMRETSGLEWACGKIITFNDSGGDPVLYSFDPHTPYTYQTHFVKNAVNIDWEDIAYGNNRIFIADVGNNYGIRDTLTIYCLRPGTLDSDTLIADTVLIFSFKDKSPGFVEMRQNAFDCEALAWIGDSLWIFTKNWLDHTTSVYRLSPNASRYSELSPSQVLDPGMLVTGADYCEENKMLWLIGYRNYQPSMRVYDLRRSSEPRLVLFLHLRNRFGLQTEAVACGPDNTVYFTYEKSRKAQGLFSIQQPALLFPFPEK